MLVNKANLPIFAVPIIFPGLQIQTPLLKATAKTLL
jgi:hypothetical protein